MHPIEPAIVVGIGELGAVFARGLLRLGRPVFPVTRGMKLEGWAERGIDPALVLCAVGEAELDSLLTGLPPSYRDGIALVQNELRPSVWKRHGLEPTVIVVWFEKKRGQDVKIVLPTVTFGPRADMIGACLDALAIPNRTVDDEDAMVFELVAKNLYILTTNIAGLETRGSVRNLWEHHRDLALGVAHEVLALEERLVERPLDREALLEAFARAVTADPEHACTGRSAPARLARALRHAGEHGIDTPILARIARSVGPR
jgi:hypothetical protein